MASAALAVSVLALVISGVAYWRQVKWAKVAARAEAQLADIEQARHAQALDERKRAAVDVRVEPVGASSHMLVVENRGPDTARDVTVDLAARATGAAPTISDSPFPATIAAGAETSAPLDENLTTAALVTATLRWIDGLGDQTRRVDLTIG